MCTRPGVPPSGGRSCGLAVTSSFGDNAGQFKMDQLTGGSGAPPILIWHTASTNDGSIWQWWPIGTPNGSRTEGETEQLHGSISGFTDFTNHGARPPKTDKSGRYCTVGCRRISPDTWGGFRIDLQSGDGSHTGFIPTPDTGANQR